MLAFESFGSVVQQADDEVEHEVLASGLVNQSMVSPW